MKKHTKILIFIALLVVLCALIGTVIYFVNDYNRNIEFTSIDDSFKITLPNKIKPKQTVINRDNTNDYVLDLISTKTESFMYVSAIDKERELDFNSLVNNEKNAISSARENVKNMSEVTSLNIDGRTSYTYSYVYFDKDYGKDLYTEVYWVIDSSKIYIFDFEVIAENIESSKEIFKNAMNSVKFNK